MKNIHLFAIAILFSLALLTSCQQPGENSTGSEYVPDMGHSIAYEANVYNYYYHNTWDSASVFKLKELSNPRLPVEGTVPRGYAGVHFASTTTAKNAAMGTLTGEGNAISVPINGNVPYYYEDTEEDRTKATEEITDNPFPITDAGIARGKELYNIACAVCHGEGGKGEKGGIYASGIYPAAPANLVNEEFSAASNGRLYHALMYGKNMMGAYADKLSYEERWQVIHYIRALQAKEAKLAYSEQENTLNPAFGMPGASYLSQNVEVEQPSEEEDNPAGGSSDGEGNSDGGQSQEGQGGGHGDGH